MVPTKIRHIFSGENQRAGRLIGRPHEWPRLEDDFLKELTERDREVLSSQMKWLGDIPRVRRRSHLPTGVLVAIHTQDLRRHIIRNYWKVKAAGPRLAGRWRRGESLAGIARSRRFSPIVIARIVASEIGVSKSDFRRMVNGSEIKHDLPRDHRRISSEISKIVSSDYMDSPWSLEIYREIGREGERLMTEWLDDKGLDFKTEKDLKGGVGVPTPDFLFPSPQRIDGRKNVSWIESKAFFGDLQHIRRHHRYQVSRYEKAYGEGMVIYWYGVSREAREEGPIYQFLNPSLFEGRDGWENLQEEIPSKLVVGATQGPKATPGKA